MSDAPRARHLTSAVAVGAGLAVAFMVGIWMFGVVHEVDYEYLTREPQAVLEGKPHAGAVSLVGIVGWSIAMTSAALGALITVGRRRHFYAASAALSAVLAFDHIFQGRDAVQFETGVSAVWVMALELLVFLVFLRHFRQELTSVGIRIAGTVVGMLVLSEGIWRWHRFARFNKQGLVNSGIALVAIAIWGALWVALVAREANTSEVGG